MVELTLRKSFSSYGRSDSLTIHPWVDAIEAPESRHLRPSQSSPEAASSSHLSPPDSSDDAPQRENTTVQVY